MVRPAGGDEIPYEIIRFPYAGTIGADGHVREPAWLWKEHLEAAHRARVIRICVDPEGLETRGLGGRRVPIAQPKRLHENVARICGLAA